MSIHISDAQLMATGEFQRLGKAELFAMAFLTRYRIQQTRDSYETALRQWFGFLADADSACLLLRPMATHALGAGGPIACAAGSASGAGDDVEVGPVVGVARRTVGLADVRGRGSVAAQHVGAVRDDLQVVGPDAERDAAEVVHVHAVGDRDAAERESDAVRSLHAALVLEGAVAMPAVGGAGPKPASVALLDLRPEAHGGVARGDGAGRHGAGSVEVRGVGMTQTAALRRSVTAFDGARHVDDSNRMAVAA